MVSGLGDSRLYRHLWGTEEAHGIFDEENRLQSWLDILVVLAEAQAELGIIPAEAARAIAAHAFVEQLDIDLIAAETRSTGHSTLGLIRGLQRILPPHAEEWVYYGTTVQDITDTWTSLALKRVGAIVCRDLWEIEALLLNLAERHRDTLMVGRTHGQPGSPITFGFKVAVWADEVRRHLERLREGTRRWLVGQLAGSVGTLGFFPSHAIELRSLFCRKLELADPGISWLTARDRIAEFVLQLSLITSSLGRIGTEIYDLQRPEIGELREPAERGSVGSITMPHKRNPELAEHLVTLSRLVRAQSGVMLESLVHEHERDGRSWKVEWIAFPEACMLSCAALTFGRRILSGLEVDEDAMRRNLTAWGGFFASEQALAALAPLLGKHRAQTILQEALASGRNRGISLKESLYDTPEVGSAFDDILAQIGSPQAASAGEMVDIVVRRGREAREGDRAVWP